jgi:alkylated DNA repair dioxygenase AlkB
MISMPDLLGSSDVPEGFRLAAELIAENQQTDLLAKMQSLPFKEFEFHGFLGKRRVISFGWRYDFTGGGLQKTDDIPTFLLPARKLAAAFADLQPADLQHVLLTEYRPGAAIGWHKDRSVFGDVIGISLLAPCTFRMRQKLGSRWRRASVMLEPRSVYSLRGGARTAWEHSIPAVASLRYSITFRTMSTRS